MQKLREIRNNEVAVLPRLMRVQRKEHKTRLGNNLSFRAKKNWDFRPRNNLESVFDRDRTTLSIALPTPHFVPAAESTLNRTKSVVSLLKV